MVWRPATFAPQTSRSATKALVRSRRIGHKGTTMKADFLDAHQRHWDDAQHLLSAQRWANADHLYGVSAECGLKRLMLAFGMAYDTAKDRPQEREDRQHADCVWDRFDSYREGHHWGAGYALPKANPFHDWKVEQRYAHQSHFDQARAQAHQAAAQAVCKLVKRAQLEGMI
jgi:hypothetical protein